MRAPFQVLIFPYILSHQNIIQFCLFKRRDLQVWQGISGGGENNELPIEAAKREAIEEAKINCSQNNFRRLISVAKIPVGAIGGPVWGNNISEVPEHAFGLQVKNKKIQIGSEHTEYKWFSFSEAFSKLEWESNKRALLELNTLLLENNKDNSILML